MDIEESPYNNKNILINEGDINKILRGSIITGFVVWKADLKISEV